MKTVQSTYLAQGKPYPYEYRVWEPKDFPNMDRETLDLLNRQERTDAQNKARMKLYRTPQ